MASIRKLKHGWRAQVARQGQRRSKVLPSKREAQDWASRQEYLILNADKVASSETFGKVMQRYARDVSSKKRGARWEVIRLEKLSRDRIAEVRMRDLRPMHFSEWRDRQLKVLAPASVLREMQVMSAVLNRARKEWQLISENPLADVARPSKPPPRDRLPTQDEMERLAISAGDDLSNQTARAHHAFLFAIETAMRAGEITKLTWADIDIERRVARLHITKNGLPREVPLSTEAIRLLKELPRLEPVFGLTPASLDALWRKLRDRAGVEDLTFHDARHAAITQLAGKLNVLELARMVGHRDLRQLQTYYNAPAEELAKRLG